MYRRVDPGGVWPGRPTEAATTMQQQQQTTKRGEGATWCAGPDSRPRAIARSREAKARAAAAGAKHGQGHPTTSDPDYEADELEFLGAIRRYQETTGRKFPTWSEALRVLKGLGYAKLMPA